MADGVVVEKGTPEEIFDHRRRATRKFLKRILKEGVIAVCEDGEERKICRNM